MIARPVKRLLFLVLTAIAGLSLSACVGGGGGGGGGYQPDAGDCGPNQQFNVLTGVCENLEGADGGHASDTGGGTGSDTGGGGGGGSDTGGGGGGGDTGGGGGGGDTGGTVVTAEEVDPNCVDGQYSETLPNPTADISSEASGYDSSQVETFIDDVLNKRYPVGAWLVEGGLGNTQIDCVDQFLQDDSSASAVIGGLGTVVHECAHMFDSDLSGFSDSAYAITPQLTLRASGGDTTSRGGDTFARSRLLEDEYQSQRAPCGGSYGSGCDSYADTYLNGDPDNSSFEGGDQGFNSVLEETVQYINSLATAYAFQDYQQYSTSAMDGLLTFLWYVERYLRMARLDYPAAYNRLTQNADWREAILTVWGRAWLMLEQTENIDKLGLEEGQLFQLVRNQELLGEIERVRQAHGCQ